MKLLILFFILFFAFPLFGQEKYYCPPVKIPMLLSGSFAELRSNHFHSGIDIKTQGVTGIPVYSAADGFISRIVVSPGGYGKALYINHPNGTTTVYGHLQSFRKDIENYVKEQQYIQKAFKTDLQVLPGKFPIKKNDQIAESGNSGSSGGPHLHFEIRDTRSEEPVNPLAYDFPVADKLAPRVFSLMITPLNDTSHVGYSSKKKAFDLVFQNGKYLLRNNQAISAYGNIGFSLHTNDYLDGSWNKCGIVTLQLMVDDELYFSHQVDRFSFSESRYINSHIDYETFVEERKRFQKTWIDPGNKLRTYNYVKGNGSLDLENSKKHKIRLLVKDSYGNSSTVELTVKGKIKEMEKPAEDPEQFFAYNRNNSYKADNIELTVPKGALYRDLDFTYKTMPPAPGLHSDIHIVHKKTTPLHKSIKIRIRATNLLPDIAQKALLVYIDDMTGEYSAAGGKLEYGWVSSNVRNFGHYAIAIDTIAPEIRPLSIDNNSLLSDPNRLRFKISDDLSGIKKIEGYIDEKWALFEYDPKNNLIVHYFDKDRFDFNTMHTFKLIVEDYRQNKATYEATFRK